MRTLRILASVSVAALLLGAMSCSAGGSARRSVALPMQQHWVAGNAIQHAMVRGDLTTARRAAGTIAEVEEIPGLSWDAGAYLQRMREQAENVANAKSFE